MPRRSKEQRFELSADSLNLPKDIGSAFARLRPQFLASATSSPPIHMLILRVKERAREKLVGPPPKMWRDEKPILWSREAATQEWCCAVLLWGASDGIEHLQQLVEQADRCLGRLDKATRSALFLDGVEALGWLGLIECTARRNVDPLLEATRWTWDGDSMIPVDCLGRVTIGKRRKMRSIFPGMPDYTFTLVEPDVHTASAHVVDALLDDAGSASLIVTVPAERRGTSQQKPQKRKRLTLARTELTSQERAAWLAYEKLGTYAAVGRDLGISRQGATKLVKKAHEIEHNRSRSIQATQTLPTGARGEALI